LLAFGVMCRWSSSCLKSGRAPAEEEKAQMIAAAATSTYIHTYIAVFCSNRIILLIGASKGTRQRTRIIEQFKKPQTIAEKDTGLLFGCCRIERKRT
jgi:hypothetical protein